MSQLFLSLALLACPVGMGAMMLMMRRSGKDEPRDGAPSENEAELLKLRAEVDELRGEREGARLPADQARQR